MAEVLYNEHILPFGQNDMENTYEIILQTRNKKTRTAVEG